MCHFRSDYQTKNHCQSYVGKTTKTTYKKHKIRCIEEMITAEIAIPLS